MAQSIPCGDLNAVDRVFDAIAVRLDAVRPRQSVQNDGAERFSPVREISERHADVAAARRVLA